MNHISPQSPSENWEASFDNWLKKPIHPQASLFSAIQNKIETDADLDSVIDEMLQKQSVNAPDNLFANVRSRLNETKKIALFPQILRWATPLAAAAAIAISFSVHHSTTSPQPDLTVANLDSSSLQFEADPELLKIFALASNLQSDTNITNLADSMDALALFVD